MLKRCKQNWGARWALRKANSTVSRTLHKAEREERVVEVVKQEPGENEGVDAGQDGEGGAGDAGGAGTIGGTVMGGLAAGANVVGHAEQRVLPGIGFFDGYGQPAAVVVEHPDTDLGYQACRALFDESKAWLASGGPRYKWQ